MFIAPLDFLIDHKTLQRPADNRTLLGKNRRPCDQIGEDEQVQVFTYLAVVALAYFFLISDILFQLFLLPKARP
jgi:hypothetical protein